MNYTLRISASPEGGESAAKETPGQTIARLSAENESLKEQLARREAADAEAAKAEEIISKKMAIGLSREQAVAVIRRQKDHDAATEKEWAKRRPQIVAILKAHPEAAAARREINEQFNGLVTVEEIAAARLKTGV